MLKPALLVLEDGTIFHGTSIGSPGSTIGEIVFNTSMTGYQEILTDPSYNNQIVTFTFPHIGNTGVNQDDVESHAIQVKGIIVRNISLINSNYRSTQNLSHYLKKNNIIAISNIDTRKLTRILRTKGTQYGYISTENNSNDTLKNTYMSYIPSLKKIDLVKKISTKKIYSWYEEKTVINEENDKTPIKKLFRIIVYDFGVKHSILRILVKKGCHVIIVPANTTIKNVLQLQPDGIILSNGPGDPRLCHYAIQSIKELIQTEIPIFGICLGHQLLALATGAKIVKMKFGHHGSNHPVKNIKTNKIMITSQNHNFAVDINNLPNNINITHISLFDKTIQGIQIKNKNIFGFQGHPEANPGPNDSETLFDKFIYNIKNQTK